MEWDYGATERKFNRTIAYITIDDAEIGWVPIKNITDDGWVIDLIENKPIGRFITEDKSYIDDGDQPIVDFLYKPIICGWYHSDLPHTYYLVTRRNRKCYTIGLSDEAYNIQEFSTKTGTCLTVPFTNWARHLKLSMPAHGVKTKHLEIFQPDFARWKNTFLTFETEVGYLFEDKYLMKSPEFTPMVKKYLEGKWQTVDL